MKVWLLHIGEELPIDGSTRTYRYGYLAKALADRGHDVLRWAPTFRHFGKTHRFMCDERVRMRANYTIQFVHGPGYRRNVGIARLHAYRVLGRRFRALAEKETPPDFVVAAIPSLEWADAAVEYGRRFHIPVFVDVRDLWPDVFLNAVPAALLPIGNRLIAPYQRIAQRVCRDATALMAVSQSYLDWGLSLAGRSQTSRDIVVPLGFESDAVPRGILQQHIASLYERGIDPERPVCLFAGSFERSHDLNTVIEAYEQLGRIGRTKTQLVLCGDGSTAAKARQRARNLRDAHFLGWVDAATLQAAVAIAQIGICPYASDAPQSLPNKPFEYMAGGLAIVSSLAGELAELLAKHECGLTYPAGDVNGLSNCITRLVLNPLQLESMRSNAQTAWHGQYRSHDIYRNFVDHLTGTDNRMLRAA